MRLITAHRILIVTAIAFFALFAAVQLRLFMRAPAAAPLIEAIISGAVAAGLLIYYRSLSRWGR